jgi:DNA-binding NarL/FixJ family response regulator
MKSSKRATRAELAPPDGLEAYRFEIGGEAMVVFKANVPGARELGGLSAAEREVAELVARGLSNAAIAKRRSTTARTVANQLAAIYRKLGVRSRAALIVTLYGPKG